MCLSLARNNDICLQDAIFPEKKALNTPGFYRRASRIPDCYFPERKHAASSTPAFFRRASRIPQLASIMPACIFFRKKTGLSTLGFYGRLPESQFGIFPKPTALSMPEFSQEGFQIPRIGFRNPRLLFPQEKKRLKHARIRLESFNKSKMYFLKKSTALSMPGLYRKTSRYHFLPRSNLLNVCTQFKGVCQNCRH